MKDFKNNNSYDNRNINILNIEFEEDENIKNNSQIKSPLDNSKALNIKLNSSLDRNFNDKNTILNENYKTNILYNKDLNEKEKDKINIQGKNLTKNNKFQNQTKNNIFHNSEIKKSDIEFNQSDYQDKSCKNWNEITSNIIEHVKNEQILNENINKNYFNNHRKFYFGRHKIDNLPYVYDISSTYMNNYYNKSEHKRHEILIDELCKLRAYLIKYPNANNIDIIKDFLIKYNIQNLEKYSNYQLLQLGKFVCQDDIYKINSLLKPYLHVKDMIYDILENSINLNNKFSGFKFNSSIDKLLTKISTEKANKKNKILDKINKNRNKVKSSTTIFNNKLKNKNNKKKFYISELDYINNSNDNNASYINNHIIENKEDEEKCDEVKNKNHKEFMIYSQKRKELLDSIGIFINKRSNQNDSKDSYSSPLLKKNNPNKKIIYDNKRFKINNVKLLQLPKINNKIVSYYKPNKLLLAPDKNYSSNFNLLLKDISNELKGFENSYHQKLELIAKRNMSQNNSIDLQNKNNNINNRNLIHSQSCKLFNSNDIDRMKKIEAANRLYYGKKTIKIDLGDIQKKHKLTEYIALANAKIHVKNDIINENVLK